MRRPWTFASLGFAALLLAVAGFLLRHALAERSAATTVRSVASSPVLNALGPGLVADAFSKAGPAVPEPAVAAVLPHHFLARTLIAEVAQRLPETPPHTIVVVGPDHRNTGPGATTTTTSDWRSSSRTYRIDREVTEALLGLSGIQVSDEAIMDEHSVFIPLPFLAQRYPDTRFVLLSVRLTFDPALIRRLADALDAELGPDDLVIGSVDFSHDRSRQAAEADDAETLRLLNGGGIETLGSALADSPATLALVRAFAERRSADEFDLIGHANSAEILGDPGLPETTSYFTYVYRK